MLLALAISNMKRTSKNRNNSARVQGTEDDISRGCLCQYCYKVSRKLHLKGKQLFQCLLENKIYVPNECEEFYIVSPHWNELWCTVNP